MTITNHQLTLFINHLYSSISFIYQSTIFINQLYSSINFIHHPTLFINQLYSSINFIHYSTLFINQLVFFSTCVTYQTFCLFLCWGILIFCPVLFFFGHFCDWKQIDISDVHKNSIEAEVEQFMKLLINCCFLVCNWYYWRGRYKELQIHLWTLNILLLVAKHVKAVNFQNIWSRIIIWW